MRLIISLLAIFFLHSELAHAIVAIANSAEEVEYSYTVQFRSLAEKSARQQINVVDLAKFHASHLHGVFHSADYLEKFDEPAELSEGFAGTKEPTITSAHILTRPEDNHIWVEYTATGKMLVISPILKAWMGNQRTGSVKLPIIQNLPEIYSTHPLALNDPELLNCTDPDFPEAAEFYYFYLPFKCTHLSKSPIGVEIELQIQRASSQKDAVLPIQEIYSDNKNGKLVILYYVFGFDGQHDSTSLQSDIRRDYGWKNYQKLHQRLVKDFGFTQIESESQFNSLLGEERTEANTITPIAMTNFPQRRFFSTHVRLSKDHTFVIRSALFDTENKIKGKPLVSFPKFWKEAIENGDFIYYGGHSGDGAALNMNNMVKNLNSANVEELFFDSNKTQIMFIDACSSYAFYTDMYLSQKPRNLYILNYGVVSLFHLAESTIASTLEIFLGSNTSLSWRAAIGLIEESQLEPHIRFSYKSEFADETIRKYQKRKRFPNLLLNVSSGNFGQ